MKNLNTAVHYCASVINYYASQNTSCDCSGIVGEDNLMEYYKQKEADWLREEQYWANQWYKTFCISQFCELFGVIAALIALAVVKQVDIVVSFM